MQNYTEIQMNNEHNITKVVIIPCRETSYHDPHLQIPIVPTKQIDQKKRQSGENSIVIELGLGFLCQNQLKALLTR